MPLPKSVRPSKGGEAAFAEIPAPVRITMLPIWLIGEPIYRVHATLSRCGGSKSLLAERLITSALG
jgi:hypothetical protein